MNSIDILNRLAYRAEREGIAVGAGYSDGKYCAAALLLDIAKGNLSTLRGARLEAYLEARRAFAFTVGCPDSYDGIAEWNDASRTTKEGIKLHYRKAPEVVEAATRAAMALQAAEKVKEARRSG